MEKTLNLKKHNPDRVMEKVLDSAAVPGLIGVEVGDPETCSRST